MVPFDFWFIATRLYIYSKIVYTHFTYNPKHDIYRYTYLLQWSWCNYYLTVSRLDITSCFRKLKPKYRYIILIKMTFRWSESGNCRYIPRLLAWYKKQMSLILFNLLLYSINNVIILLSLLLISFVLSHTNMLQLGIVSSRVPISIALCVGTPRYTNQYIVILALIFSVHLCIIYTYTYIPYTMCGKNICWQYSTRLYNWKINWL